MGSGSSARTGATQGQAPQPCIRTHSRRRRAEAGPWAAPCPARRPCPHRAACTRSEAGSWGGRTGAQAQGPAGSSQLGAAGVSWPGLVQHAHSRARPQMGSGRTGRAQQGRFGQAPRCRGQEQSLSVGHSPPRAEGSPRRAQAGLWKATEPCPPPTPTTSLAWRKAWTPQGSSEGPEAEGCTSGVCPHPSQNPFSLLWVGTQLPLSTPAHPQGCRLTRGCPAEGGRTGRHWQVWPGPPRRSAGSQSAGGTHMCSLQPAHRRGSAWRGPGSRVTPAYSPRVSLEGA